MRAAALLLAATLACRTPPSGPSEPEPEPPPAPEPTAPAEEAPSGIALPEGFRVVGEAEVEPAFLPPEAAWRGLVSQLTSLRAEARERGEDLLVTFEERAFHATGRAGDRRTWLLPEGLTLTGTPVHLLLGADLELHVYGPDGVQIPSAGEITAVGASVGEGAAGQEQFRLVIKGGRTFRSISNPG